MSNFPNIVWITLESTRADATSVGNARAETTPNLQRIGASPSGHTFGSCFSHGIWTLASSASILAGTYPTCHDAGMGSEAIPDTIPTVPEALREVGYTTACISPNSHLSSATGLDRGFDQFAWVSKSTLLDTVGARAILKYALNVRRHGGGLTLDSRRHHRGYMLNDLAKRWMRSFRDSDDPYFLYLHHPGPHHPYTPPERYLTEFLPDCGPSTEEAIEIALDHHDNLFEHIANGIPFDDRELSAIEALYRAEVAYADELVGNLFEFVRNRTSRDTIVVVTADHGELFGEDDLLAHMISVNDAVCHVPLVVYGLDRDLPTAGPVQHTDIVRTIFSEIGVDGDWIQGVDLTEATRDWAVVQRGVNRTEQNLSKLTEIEPAYDASRYRQSTVTALRTDSFKYVYSDEGEALFEPPNEDTDVSPDYPDRTAKLRADAESLLANEATPYEDDTRDGEFTDAMRSQLADLGYLVD